MHDKRILNDPCPTGLVAHIKAALEKKGIELKLNDLFWYCHAAWRPLTPHAKRALSMRFDEGMNYDDFRKVGSAQGTALATEQCDRLYFGNVADMVVLVERMATGPSQTLAELGLSRLIIRCLSRAGITTIHALAHMPPEAILNIRGLGVSALEDIQEALQHYRLVRGEPLEPKPSSEPHGGPDDGSECPAIQVNPHDRQAFCLDTMRLLLDGMAKAAGMKPSWQEPELLGAVKKACEAANQPLLTGYPFQVHLNTAAACWPILTGSPAADIRWDADNGPLLNLQSGTKEVLRLWAAHCKKEISEDTIDQAAEWAASRAPRMWKTKDEAPVYCMCVTAKQAWEAMDTDTPLVDQYFNPRTARLLREFGVYTMEQAAGMDEELLHSVPGLSARNVSGVIQQLAVWKERASRKFGYQEKEG